MDKVLEKVVAYAKEDNADCGTLGMQVCELLRREGLITEEEYRNLREEY